MPTPRFGGLRWILRSTSCCEGSEEPWRDTAPMILSVLGFRISIRFLPCGRFFLSGSKVKAISFSPSFVSNTSVTPALMAPSNLNCSSSSLGWRTAGLIGRPRISLHAASLFYISDSLDIINVSYESIIGHLVFNGKHIFFQYLLS